MNPICPRDHRVCLICDMPCKAPEINPEATAVPEGKPFTGILATVVKITDTVSVSTNLTDTMKITITGKL